MDSKKENNNKALTADQQETQQLDHPGSGMELLKETGSNKIFLQMMLEIYAYSITEDTVSGMHLPQGKAHHAYQMNV